VPGKKNKNAFFFRFDWKKKKCAKAEKQTFPNELKDVQRNPDCSEEWQVILKITQKHIK